MNKIEAVSKRISNIKEFRSFTQISCVEKRNEFAIFSDYKGQSYIVTDSYEDKFEITVDNAKIVIERDDSKLFQIRNSQKVVFIPVDGKKGLLRFSDSYCDAIIFDEIDFCFVEFKLNATSLKKATDNRVKAFRQLSNTIELFDERLNRNYEGLHLEAYVCTPLFYPRNDATWKKLSVEFLEKYGVPIFETNEKLCKHVV